jgi:hypothetical protein
MMRSLLFIALVVAGFFWGCSGDDDNPATVSPVTGSDATRPPASASVPASTPPPSTITPSAAGLTQQSLVYIDRRKPGPAEVWVAEHNGANPKMVTTSTTLRRPLDVAGKTLAATGPEQLQFIDLVTGQTRTLPEPVFINDGRFVSPQTFVYIALGGCAGGGQLGSSVYKVDMTTLQSTPLLQLPANLQVSGFDSTSIALAPRGCDPAVKAIDVYRLVNGQPVRTVPIEGCGWAGIDLARMMAAASWKSCNPPANRADEDVSVVDFRAATPAARGFSSAQGEPNTWPFLFRPGSAQLTMGLTRTEGTGPGSTRGGGIWLLNLDTLAIEEIQPAGGAEQYVLDWTEDGRYALTATVEAQGLCSFAFVDATTKQVMKVNPDITVCGANGEVIGWTALR